jgi:hypothetical protein
MPPPERLFDFEATAPGTCAPETAMPPELDSFLMMPARLSCSQSLLASKLRAVQHIESPWCVFDDVKSMLAGLSAAVQLHQMASRFEYIVLESCFFRLLSLFRPELAQPNHICGDPVAAQIGAVDFVPYFAGIGPMNRLSRAFVQRPCRLGLDKVRGLSTC